RPEVSSLQRGDILEGMAGDDEVIGIGCCGKDCGIVQPCTNVVVRRIAQQCVEMPFLVRTAEIGHPQGSTAEAMISNHVHDTDARKRCRKKVRALVDNRTDQQTAIGLALYHEPVSARYAFSLEEVPRGCEVIIRVLPFLELSGHVPRPTVLSAAPDIGDGKNSPLLDP